MGQVPYRGQTLQAAQELTAVSDLARGRELHPGGRKVSLGRGDQIHVVVGVRLLETALGGVQFAPPDFKMGCEPGLQLVSLTLERGVGERTAARDAAHDNDDDCDG